jgi:hypothetical protein
MFSSPSTSVSPPNVSASINHPTLYSPYSNTDVNFKSLYGRISDEAGEKQSVALLEFARKEWGKL